jgi:DNA-binding FadR family transcriptional regulator
MAEAGDREQLRETLEQPEDHGLVVLDHGRGSLVRTAIG